MGASDNGFLGKKGLEICVVPLLLRTVGWKTCKYCWRQQGCPLYYGRTRCIYAESSCYHQNLMMMIIIISFFHDHVLHLMGFQENPLWSFSYRLLDCESRSLENYGIYLPKPAKTAKNWRRIPILLTKISTKSVYFSDIAWKNFFCPNDCFDKRSQESNQRNKICEFPYVVFTL